MTKLKKEILVATENKGKAREIADIFSDSDFNIRFLSEFRDQIPDLEIVENAKSFEGNALIKAIVIGEALNMITLADDSGICIDALNGAPGVYSARYSKEKTDEANNQKVLAEMKDFLDDEKRSCHYHCSVAIFDPKTKFVETVEGKWHGRLALEPRGTKSFGYAPLFLPVELNYQKTNAEFDASELIRINHRGKAFKKALLILEKYFQQL